MKSRTMVALVAWLAVAPAAMAAPVAIRQAMVESLPRLAQSQAYQSAGAASSVQTPSVAEIAQRFNQILTAPLPQDPEFRSGYIAYQDSLLSSLAQGLGTEDVTDERLARVLEARARSDNAQAEALLPALWAAEKISPEQLGELEDKARSLLVGGKPFLTQGNAQTVARIIEALSEQRKQVLKQGIRRAERIARDSRDALLRAGLSEPDLSDRSDAAADLKEWLAADPERSREPERPRLNRPDSDAPRGPKTEPPAPNMGADQALRTAAGNIAEAFKAGFGNYQGRNLFYYPFVYEGNTAKLKEAEGSELLNISLEHRPDGKLLVRSKIWYIQRLLAMGGFMAEATDEPGAYLVSPKQVAPEKSLQWYEDLHIPRLGKRVTREMIASVFMKTLPEGEYESQFRANGSNGDGIAVVTRPKNKRDSARNILLAHSNINSKGIYVHVFEDYPEFAEIMAASGLYAEPINDKGYYLVHFPVRTPEDARWGGDILGQPE